MKGGTELQAWGCPRALKRLQDQGLEGPGLECLKLRQTRAQGHPRD